MRHFKRQQLRLVILRTLNEDPHYRMNAQLLTDFAHQVGVSATRDQVITELGWLKDQGLVIKEKVEGLPVIVAELTADGADVATGRRQVDGIPRPSPKRG